MPTQHASCTFTVKEGSPSKDGANDAPCWILLELHDELNVLANGMLGLNLPPDTGIDRANEIAEYLRANVPSVAFTKF